MKQSNTRKNTVSLQLIEWLLDQLQSEEELETITRQIEALVLPLQGKPRADLYAHISRCIIERYSTNPGESSARAYAQLCLSLFLASIHDPSGPNHMMALHDHIFSLCINASPLGYNLETAGQLGTVHTGRYSVSDSIQDTVASQLRNTTIVTSIENLTLLVSSLFGFGLISVAQVYQFMFQLTRPSSTSSTRCSLPEVCTLLEAHGRDLNATPWEGEMARLLEWAKTTMLEHGVDGHTQRRMRAVTLSLGGSQEQESLSEANYENSFRSPKLPSGEEGLDENNYGSHTSAHEIGVNSSFQSAETMELKLFAMLDQLEAGDFDHISDQIIEWLNKTSGWEGDGQALMRTIKLICKRARDNAAFSEMYARLCRKMMERVSPTVQDETIKNWEGQPITGGMLFRKYLLNQCQEDFERGWSAKESALAAAALKSGEDKAAEAASENNGEAVLYSEEYYAAAKAKRQGLGLVRFIGELFKLSMLTERIMHECIKKLLSNVVNPEEEEIESLCKLLTTVGQSLDSPRARNHMNIYFERMQDMAKSNNINSRSQFMLLDVIELRARHWQTRVNTPRPAPAHRDSSRDDSKHGVTRGGSRRGEHRGNATEPDGWNVPGAGASRPSTRAGDLSQFGKISKPTGIQFGPSSVFSKKDASKRESSVGRASGANMFSALSAAAPDRPPPPIERMTSSRKPSIDRGPGGSPATSSTGEKRKLVLQPRIKPAETDTNKAEEEEKDEEKDEGIDEATSVGMAEEGVKNRVNEDVKEYIGLENIDETILSLETIPSEHRYLFVDKLINASMEGGNKVVLLAEKLFSAVRSRSVISPEGFERGIIPTVSMADDLSIDVPKLYEWLARMIHAAGLDRSRVEEMADQISVYGYPRVPPRELLIKEFEKVSST